MSRRWLSLALLVPAMVLTMTGCLTAGSQQFNASAIVAVPYPVIVNFSYDVRDGKNHIRGHLRDDVVLVFIKFEGVLQAFKNGPDINCMGAEVFYVPEDPNNPISGSILDSNGNPLFPNEGQIFIDACDNNKDQMPDIGDTFDALITVPALPNHAGYLRAGPVIKGDFQCQFPQPCTPV